MSSYTMTKQEMEQADIIPWEPVGPCTAALNEFAARTEYRFFYDFNRVSTETYYIKLSKKNWKEIFWRQNPEYPNSREFEDSDMNLASRCLSSFQDLCDQQKISTRSAFAFYRSLTSYLNRLDTASCSPSV